MTGEERDARLDALDEWLADFERQPGAALIPEWREAFAQLRREHGMLEQRYADEGFEEAVIREGKLMGVAPMHHGEVIGPASFRVTPSGLRAEPERMFGWEAAKRALMPKEPDELAELEAMKDGGRP